MARRDSASAFLRWLNALEFAGDLVALGGAPVHAFLQVADFLPDDLELAFLDLCESLFLARNRRGRQSGKQHEQASVAAVFLHECGV